MAYNFTMAQAQAYYNTLPPAEKAKVDAIGGPNVEWLTNAVNAGVPDAVRAAGGGNVAEGGWQEPGDAVLDPSGAAHWDEWYGKRMPTPAEFRKWAQDQHSQYTSGNTGAQDEDYARYGDAQLKAWLDEGWDVGGGWKSGYGPHGQIVNHPAAAGGGGGPAPGGPGGPAGGGNPWGGWGGFAGGNMDWSNTPWGQFKAPSYEDALNDPGYQFSLKQGQEAMERSAAARGVLRTGGTLKDITNYGQDAAANRYGDVFNRALQGWQANLQPTYGAWNTLFGANEDRWRTQYAGDLSKWTTNQNNALSRWTTTENNIYGLINQPPPMMPSY